MIHFLILNENVSFIFFPLVHRISINIACLHPRFGEKTPKQILEEMRKEEEEGEIDVNLKEYVQQRNRARQSPFPTFVLEVRATPPMTPPTQVSSSSPPPPSPSASFFVFDIYRSYHELFLVFLLANLVYNVFSNNYIQW